MKKSLLKYNLKFNFKGIALVLFVALFQLNTFSQVSATILDSIVYVNKFKKYVTISVELSRERDKLYENKTLVFYNRESPTACNTGEFFQVHTRTPYWQGEDSIFSDPPNILNPPYRVKKIVDLKVQELERNNGNSSYERITVAPNETKIIHLKVRTCYIKKMLKSSPNKRKNSILHLGYTVPGFNVNFYALEKYERENCSSCLLRFDKIRSNIVMLKSKL